GALLGCGGGGVGGALLCGGVSRKSAARASSAARRRARSDRSPSARAWHRQTMRLMRQGRLVGLGVSPHSSAESWLSWPTLSRSSVATSLTIFSSTGFSFLWLVKSTRVDSEPQFAEKCKAIRDKKERFLN